MKINMKKKMNHLMSALSMCESYILTESVKDELSYEELIAALNNLKDRINTRFNAILNK